MVERKADEMIWKIRRNRTAILSVLLAFILGLIVAQISLAATVESESGMIAAIVAEKPSEPVFQCPEDGLVEHPCREPDELLMFKISRYDPSLGGTNCSNWSFELNDCISATASGADWRDGFEMFSACPPSFPFGTVFEIGSKRWICKDRGGAIQQNSDGSFWVDLLSKDLNQYDLIFGQIVQGSVWFPRK